MRTKTSKKKSGKTEREYKRVLVLPDIHVPVHDIRSITPVLSYARTQWWDELVQLGDFMDFACISHHNKNKLRLVEGRRVLEDYDVANILLDDIVAAVRKQNPQCRITFLEGNHDGWIERFMEAQPALTGMLEVDKNLRFKERTIKGVRSWSEGETYRLGRAGFIHGDYTNVHHAKKSVEAYGNIFYGDTHSIQCFLKVYKGKDKTEVGQSLGCLCLYNQIYLRGRATGWQQAFAEFNIFPDGFFQYAVTSIFKHRFVGQNGKVYQG